MADDENALVNRAAQGDSEAFSRLFESYYDMMHAFIFRLCLDAGETNDLAQETFIKAARALPFYRRESSFKNWLYRIAVNVVRDWQRVRARRSTLVDALMDDQHTREQSRSADVSHVRDALLKLSDDLRQSVVLVYFEGMNHAEAGRIIGCAETTVSWRIFRAKRELKSALSPGSDGR